MAGLDLPSERPSSKAGCLAQSPDLDPGTGMTSRSSRLSLLLTWREHGGLPVNGQPDKEGFGSLLARLTTNQFGGKNSPDWNRGGSPINLCTLSGTKEPEGNSQSMLARPAEPGFGATSTTIFVVEPDILVRTVIADYLRDCGYKGCRGREC